MESRPLVSVLIPVFNAARYLEAAVWSILNQTHQRLEVLICDDGSNDRSWQILQSVADPRVLLSRNNSNQGYLRTVNHLASMANGEFLCFQDADDLSHVERVELQLKALQSHPAWGLVGTNSATITPSGRLWRTSHVVTDPVALKGLLALGNPFQKPSIMFRRNALEKVGMFREEFLALGNISEDFDWILRVSESFDVGNINHTEPLYQYRSVPSAMTKNISSADQLFGHDVALFLARERRSGRADSIARGDLATVRSLIEEWKAPYLKDSSLLCHRVAESLMYSGLSKHAVRKALLAVWRNPFAWRNYRLLQHCARKTLLGI